MTLQSNVWTDLPKSVSDALFKDVSKYTEMWPRGPDSPNQYPRNIPVKYVEDQLLLNLQEDDIGSSIELVLKRFDKKSYQSGAYNFLVLADGAASRTEQDILPKNIFGERTPIPECPNEKVLGIYFESENDVGGLTELESMVLTISQNR